MSSGGGSDSSAAAGVCESGPKAMHPYLGWSGADAARLWGVLGCGEGKIVEAEVKERFEVQKSGGGRGLCSGGVGGRIDAGAEGFRGGGALFRKGQRVGDRGAVRWRRNGCGSRRKRAGPGRCRAERSRHRWRWARAGTAATERPARAWSWAAVSNGCRAACRWRRGAARWWRMRAAWRNGACRGRRGSRPGPGPAGGLSRCRRTGGLRRAASRACGTKGWRAALRLRAGHRRRPRSRTQGRPRRPRARRPHRPAGQVVAAPRPRPCGRRSGP